MRKILDTTGQSVLAWAARHPHLESWVRTGLEARRPRRLRQKLRVGSLYLTIVHDGAVLLWRGRSHAPGLVTKSGNAAGTGVALVIVKEGPISS